MPRIPFKWYEAVRPAMRTIEEHWGAIGKYLNRKSMDKDMEFNVLANRFGTALHPLMQAPRETLDRIANARRVNTVAQLAPAEKELNGFLDDYLAITMTEQRLNGPLIDSNGFLRLPEPQPNYFPEIMSPKAREILGSKNPRLLGQRKQLEDDFVAQYLADHPNASRETALDEMQNFLYPSRGVTAATPEPTHSVLRMPARDLHLPPSWQMNPQEALASHAQMVAQDLAYHRTFEVDPIIRKFFGIADDGRGNKTPDTVKMENTGMGPEFDTGEIVKNAMAGNDGIVKQYWDYVNLTKLGYRSDIWERFSSVATAGLIGTKSAVRDYVSALANMGETLQIKEWRYVPGAMLDMMGGKVGKDFFKRGIMRELKPFEFHAMDDLHKASANVADILRTGQARNFFELQSRGMLYEMGRLITPARVIQGDDAFFRNMNIYDWKQLDAERLKDLVGFRLMEFVQGSYGPRGLPLWLMPGGRQNVAMRTALSLARWSVERYNNWTRSVFEPMLKGDMRPMLKSLIGHLVAPAGLEGINELVFDQKPYGIGFREWLGLRDKPHIGKVLFSKFQLTGFGGILGEVANNVYGITQGQKPQEFQYPFFIAYGSAMQRTGQAIEALKFSQDFGDFLDTIVRLPAEIAKDNIQLLRLMTRDKPEDVGQREKRFYRQIYGAPTGVGNEAAQNPFLPTRGFLDARTAGEAAAALPEVQRSFERSGQVPSVGSTFQPMSAVEGAPSFLDFVQQMGGQERAAEVYSNQVRTSALAQQKNAMLAQMRERKKQQTLQNWINSGPPGSFQ